LLRFLLSLTTFAAQDTAGNAAQVLVDESEDGSKQTTEIGYCEQRQWNADNGVQHGDYHSGGRLRSNITVTCDKNNDNILTD